MSKSQTIHRGRPEVVDEWDRQWRLHWSRIGTPGYELPVGGPGAEERDFLAHARTPAKERQRLERVNDEFERAFKALYPVGPAVTVKLIAPGKPRVVVIHGEDEARSALAKKIQQQFRPPSALRRMGDVIEI